MRPFIALVYIFVEHDVEAWACLLSEHNRNSTAKALCTELRVARYLLIPLLVLGVTFLALVVWLRLGAWRGEGVAEECASSGGESKRAKAQV